MIDPQTPSGKVSTTSDSFVLVTDGFVLVADNFVLIADLIWFLRGVGPASVLTL
mgnify:CR=1 FL=1